MSGIHAIYSTFAKTHSTMRQKLVSLTPACLNYRQSVVGACDQVTSSKSIAVQQSYRNYHTLSLRSINSLSGSSLTVSRPLHIVFA